MRLAFYHLERDAQVWIQRNNALRPQIDWEEFKEELMLQVGMAPYDGELCKLKKTTTVRDYQSIFERMPGKAEALTDK